MQGKESKSRFDRIDLVKLLREQTLFQHIFYDSLLSKHMSFLSQFERIKNIRMAKSLVLTPFFLLPKQKTLLNLFSPHISHVDETKCFLFSSSYYVFL